jgi:hypothetical protein
MDISVTDGIYGLGMSNANPACGLAQFPSISVLLRVEQSMPQ